MATLPPPPLYYKSQPTTPLMDFDTDFWSEIQDSSGEIFDIPEMQDEEDNDDRTWNAFLNSNWDF